MIAETEIAVERWALPGEPFVLAAVPVAGAEWAAHVSASAREKIGAYADGEARARAGASEWLKGVWFPREIGLDRVEFAVGKHGKPMPTGAAAEWGINVSHAGDYAVAALARGVRMGVDLERLNRKANVEGLSARVFSESERAIAREGERDAFFAIWAKKEAVLKALGCGWADGEAQARTRLDLQAYQIEPSTGAQVWCRRAVDRRYVLAVAMLPLDGE
jgi:phosphopantetheine--protein transferase-like protein